MTDTEIVDYLEEMLSWSYVTTASFKLTSKDNKKDLGVSKLYRCGDGPWRVTLREAVRAKKEQRGL